MTVHYGAPGWLRTECGKQGLGAHKTLDLDRVTCKECRKRRLAWIKECDEQADREVDDTK